MAAGITFDKSLFATELNHRRDALRPKLGAWVNTPLASDILAAHCLAALGMLLATKIVAGSSIRGGEKAFHIAQKELIRHVGQGLANLKQEHADFTNLELPEGMLKFDSFSKMEMFHTLWLLALVGVPEEQHLKKVSPLISILEMEIKVHLEQESPLRRAIFPPSPFPMGDQGVLPIDGLTSDTVSEGEGADNDSPSQVAVASSDEWVTQTNQTAGVPFKRKRGRPRKALS